MIEAAVRFYSSEYKLRLLREGTVLHFQNSVGRQPLFGVGSMVCVSLLGWARQASCAVQ